MKTWMTVILVLGWAIAALATTARPTVRERMNAIIFPAAPLLSDKVQLRDAIQWTAWMTRRADPSGRGIPITLDGEQMTGNTTSATMAVWYNLDDEDAEPPSHMTKVRFSDYIEYLARESESDVTITEDCVEVNSRRN